MQHYKTFWQITAFLNSATINKNTVGFFKLSYLGICGLLMMTGCQTVPKVKPSSKTFNPSASKSVITNTTKRTTAILSQQNNMLTPTRLDSFLIFGKIGITMPVATNTSSLTEDVNQNYQQADNNNTALQATTKMYAGSAFYTWGQQKQRFTIKLSGALGIGKTTIEYNGETAKLTSEKTGTVNATDPEALLQKVTGWQVPISQLPYWISGHAAPSDLGHQTDRQNRLAQAINGDWQAQFYYAENERLPNKLIIKDNEQRKVILTITHQNPSK